MVEFNRAVFFALNNVYLRAFIDRTPKDTSVTANAWDLVDNKNGTFSFINPFGELILILEEGSKPHIIKPKNKKALRWKSGGKSIFAKSVKHPGTKARLFIQDILLDEALYEKFQNVLWERMEVEIEKAF